MVRPVIIGTKCKVCKRLHPRNECRWQLSERGLCPGCEGLAELIRQRMKAARRCGRKPPEHPPPCPFCGGPSDDPILWRPDADWTYRCVNGCYVCKTCERLVRSFETCPHDPRKKRRRNKVGGGIRE